MMHRFIYTGPQTRAYIQGFAFIKGLSKIVTGSAQTILALQRAGLTDVVR